MENKKIKQKPPVSTEGESIIYHPSIMEEYKMYEIEWKGEMWALRKHGKGVDFYKFSTDEKEEEYSGYEKQA